jgi:hypothetical protein
LLSARSGEGLCKGSGVNAGVNTPVQPLKQAIRHLPVILRLPGPNLESGRKVKWTKAAFLSHAPIAAKLGERFEALCFYGLGA